MNIVDDIEIVVDFNSFPEKDTFFDKKKFKEEAQEFISKSELKFSPKYIYQQNNNGNLLEIEIRVFIQNRNTKSNNIKVISLFRMSKTDSVIEKKIKDAQKKFSKDDNGLIFVFDCSESFITRLTLKDAIFYKLLIKGNSNTNEKLIKSKEKAIIKQYRNTRIKGIFFITEKTSTYRWNNGGVFYRNPYSNPKISGVNFDLLKQYCKLHKEHFGSLW